VRRRTLSRHDTTSQLTVSLTQDIWQESKSYRIADHVHVVETTLIQRLKNSSCFEWWPVARLPPPVHNPGLPRPFKRPKPTCDMLELCMFLRRFEPIRYEFAAAVGKQLFSEHILNIHRSPIIEHRRAVDWAQR